MRHARALVIGISQSGQSPDIVGVIAAARRQGAPTIALTNDPGSALASAAEHQIDLRAGPEEAVGATKTYTAELLAVAMLVSAHDLDALLARLGELGVDRIMISDREDALDAAENAIRLPAGLPDWLMPIVAIVPGQFLAVHLARARSIDPGNPRWINKVTITR